MIRILSDTLDSMRQTRIVWFQWTWILLFLPELIFQIVLVDNSVAEEIILFDRLKIEPEIALMESYNDNIYRSDTNIEDDFITSLFPSVDMLFAISSQTKLNVIYSGRFDFYNDADNFKTDHHYGNTSIQFESEKGSALEIGGWGEDSANQPFSIDDRSKDYTIGALYSDLSVAVSEVTVLFGSYQHSIRRFDQDVDQRDDYDRDSFAAGMVYSRSSLFPVLLEYRYETQDNDQTNALPTEFVYQAAFTGFKWRQDRRLSGSLRIGYLWSDYNGENAYDGWATDTDITYRVSSFSRLTATARRGVRESTRTARETLDYYIYAGSGLTFYYTRLDPVRLTLSGEYENRDFRSQQTSTAQREDDFYFAEITLEYRLRDWMSVYLGYRHRVNDSNLDSLDYRENRVFAEVYLLTTRRIRKQHRSYGSSKINNF